MGRYKKRNTAVSRGTRGRNTVRLGLGREGFAEEGDLSNSKEKRMNIGGVVWK